MLNYQYAYSLWTLLFLVLWLILFLARKDIRKEMFVISFLFGFAGVVTEAVHVIDWWQPLTLTNTSVGLEDFFIGFFIGGVAAVIYEEIFKKRLQIRKISKKKDEIENFRFGLMLLILTIIFFFCFFILRLHSFYSLMISLFIALTYIFLKRKDLIDDSIISGILMLIIGSLTYTILVYFYPEFINRFWYLGNWWFAKLIFGIPIAEFLWWFFAGAFIGPLYAFWKEAKIRNEYY